MKTIKRNSYDEQQIKTQIKNDTSFNPSVNQDKFGDIYSYLYKNKPEFTENPNATMKAFLQAKDHGVENIKSNATGKEFSSYVAAKNLMKVYDHLNGKLEDDCRKKDPDFDSKSDEEQEKALNELVTKQPLNVKIRINQKIEEAKKDTEEQVEAARCIGFTGKAGEEQQVSRDSVMNMLNMMKRNDMVRKILLQAGKMINTAKHNIHSRCTGNEEIIGIEYGDDIPRVLPAELALFGNEQTKKLQSLRYLKKELAQFEKESEQSKTMGDIVVVLDESGSMSTDDNIVKAKAMLFGIMELAKHDNRKVHLIGFGGEYEGYEIKDLNMEVLLEQVVFNFRNYGRTNFEVPLRKAMNLCGKDSDIVFITDGYAPISNALIDEVNTARENGLKVITMQFGGICNEDLQKISSSFNTTWSLFVDKALG